jgi:1-deoxy-D-xylulose-5-phosphate reductoisomerase
MDDALMTERTRKKVVLLGSTGSIGRSTLEVARLLPERIELVGLAANGSVEALAAQVRETGVKHVALYDTSRTGELRALVPDDVKILAGPEGLAELAALEGADTVLVAIVGTAGLQPALAAIEAGKDLAVASKEILVMAGEIVTAAAARKGVTLLPVDSEHNAIFQCLDGHRGGEREVSRLILTASGGPFRTWPAEQLAGVTLAQALKHPTWEMGRKITIDSATLFNKGLEMIEARWLFGIGMERIDVVVHPQSIVHSMVEFIGRLGAGPAQPHGHVISRSSTRSPGRSGCAGGLKALDFAGAGEAGIRGPARRRFPGARAGPPRQGLDRRDACRRSSTPPTRSRWTPSSSGQTPLPRDLGLCGRGDGCA